ncbi:hypothetical protein OF83DRAFT_62509 [Amylostereum chailletii]|nr:hypothetical protein OF83DRAFT_62509 [Amylostereum chailletii]
MQATRSMNTESKCSKPVWVERSSAGIWSGDWPVVGRVPLCLFFFCLSHLFVLYSFVHLPRVLCVRDSHERSFWPSYIYSSVHRCSPLSLPSSARSHPHFRLTLTLTFASPSLTLPILFMVKSTHKFKKGGKRKKCVVSNDEILEGNHPPYGVVPETKRLAWPHFTVLALY